MSENKGFRKGDHTQHLLTYKVTLK